MDVIKRIIVYPTNFKIERCDADGNLRVAHDHRSGGRKPISESSRRRMQRIIRSDDCVLTCIDRADHYQIERGGLSA